MPGVKIEDIIKFLFGEELKSCSDRFKLVNANVSCIKKQLYATAQIEALHKADEDISGATIALFDAGVDIKSSRFCRGALGPAMGKSDTTVKLPLALATSIFPFEMKEMMKISIFVAISTPGKADCVLHTEVSVHPNP